jgi:hypothetical protein
MPIMPYTTEKSPVFQVVESYVNVDRPRLLQLLWDLLDGGDIASLDPVDSTTLDVAPYYTPALRRVHAKRDWWGYPEVPPPGSKNYQPPQEPFNRRTHPYSGFWNHWYGDAEKIFRETMIRAFSLSLGLPREDAATTEEFGGGPRPPDLQNTPGRDGQHWPITILWKCPEPWYEGWIEFQEWGSGRREGHVTVVLSTPAHGRPLYDTPVRPLSSVANDPYHAYELNPPDRRGPTGLWVVSHVLNYKWYPRRGPGVPSAPTSWGPPVLGAPVESLGAVVCVSPAVGDGGASPTGIPYVKGSMNDARDD